MVINKNYYLRYLTKKASLFEREECTNRNMKESLQTYTQLDKYCSKWHSWAFIVLFEQTNNNYTANKFQLTRRWMLHCSEDHYNSAKSCIRVAVCMGLYIYRHDSIHQSSRSLRRRKLPFRVGKWTYFFTKLGADDHIFSQNLVWIISTKFHQKSNLKASEMII